MRTSEHEDQICWAAARAPSQQQATSSRGEAGLAGAHVALLNVPAPRKYVLAGLHLGHADLINDHEALVVVLGRRHVPVAPAAHAEAADVLVALDICRAVDEGRAHVAVGVDAGGRELIVAFLRAERGAAGVAAAAAGRALARGDGVAARGRPCQRFGERCAAE